MTAPFRYYTDDRWAFIDLVILKFYDHTRQLGIDRVARRMLRAYAVADTRITPADLKRLAKTMPQLTVDPEYVRQACEDADALPALRAGKSVSSDSGKLIPPRAPRDRLCFRVSPYELVLLEHLQSLLKLTSRQWAFVTVIRQFAMMDVAFDPAVFRRFAIKQLDEWPRAERKDNELQLDAFVSKKKAA